MGNNISSSNIAGNCNLKCSYSFQYPNSSCVATNSNGVIYLTYDKSNVPPVVYNENKYQVSTIVIIPYSNQYFNGNPSDAELVIIHEPVLGGPLLFVFVPIIQSSSSTTATSILTQIITSVSSGAPNQGEQVTVSMSNYSLQNIVPNTPFYTYTYAKGYEFICFGLESAIPLNTNMIQTL